MFYEGPRIPRSCDPDWRMRDESGNIKPELIVVWNKMQLAGISEEAVEDVVNRVRGERVNTAMLDDASFWPVEEKEPKKPTIEQKIRNEQEWNKTKEIRGLNANIVLSDDFHEYPLTDETRKLIKEEFGVVSTYKIPPLNIKEEDINGKCKDGI